MYLKIMQMVESPTQFYMQDSEVNFSAFIYKSVS